MSHSKRVERSIEALCNKGCRSVWEDINALEQGHALQETRGLNGAEIAQVVAELRQVMAVYEGKCSPD
jgi:hypothetical protein